MPPKRKRVEEEVKEEDPEEETKAREASQEEKDEINRRTALEQARKPFRQDEGNSVSFLTDDEFDQDLTRYTYGIITPERLKRAGIAVAGGTLVRCLVQKDFPAHADVDTFSIKECHHEYTRQCCVDKAFASLREWASWFPQSTVFVHSRGIATAIVPGIPRNFQHMFSCNLAMRSIVGAFDMLPTRVFYPGGKFMWLRSGEVITCLVNRLIPKNHLAVRGRIEKYMEMGFSYVRENALDDIQTTHVRSLTEIRKGAPPLPKPDKDGDVVFGKIANLKVPLPEATDDRNFRKYYHPAPVETLQHVCEEGKRIFKMGSASVGSEAFLQDFRPVPFSERISENYHEPESLRNGIYEQLEEMVKPRFPLAGFLPPDLHALVGEYVGTLDGIAWQYAIEAAHQFEESAYFRISFFPTAPLQASVYDIRAWAMDRGLLCEAGHFDSAEITALQMGWAGDYRFVEPSPIPELIPRPAVKGGRPP